MAPIIPLDREMSISERSLTVPDDATIDKSGMHNDAYEDDDVTPHREEGLYRYRKTSPESGENRQFQDDKEPVKGSPEKHLSNNRYQQSELDSINNKVNCANGPTGESERHHSAIESSRVLTDCAVNSTDSNLSRGGSTDGSTVEEVNTPSIIDSRKGTISNSPTIHVEMLHEEKPMIETKESKPKIVEKSNLEAPSETRHEEEGEEGNWDKLKNGMHKIRQPMMQKYNALPPDPTRIERVKYALSCPPHGKIGRVLTSILLFILLWGTLVYVTDDMAKPGGTLFSLLILIVTAQLGGNLVAKMHLPPLLGMLLVGIIFRSAPYIDAIGYGIQTEWSSGLRSIALAVILIRAGLGLDPDALRKLSFVVFRLAVMPCLTEAFIVSVVSHFLLGFPWKWGFLLGFILAAVSPAVVVPCLLNLADQGYGVEKGIPTLVIAAASIDDVIAISGFGICLGTIFSKGSALMQGLKGPLEVIIGIGYGIIVGVILWTLPSRREGNANIYRYLLLLLAGLLAIFGSKGIDFGGAGALGCLCVAFVAGYGWRKQGRIENKTQPSEFFNFTWLILQPLLFGLIGTEIRVADLHPATVGWGVVTLMVGLTFRVIVSFFAVMGGGLTLKERFFVALAWLPKATVQAAIGSTALDFARGLIDDNNDMAEEILLGTKVLTIAVLVILITAPIGAVAIMLSAPKLLKKKDAKEDGKADAES